MKVKDAVRNIALEFYDKARLKPGQTVIVGCSTSEIIGQQIGTNSNTDIGLAVFNALHSVFSERDISLAAQCCEHLNRAIIVERNVADGYNIVNVVPTPDAGGAFAAAAFRGFSDPVAVETFQADAGLDIGSTLIGMHLKRVAVPLRLNNKVVGKASVVAARTRPPLIGGNRAGYDEKLL